MTKTRKKICILALCAVGVALAAVVTYFLCTYTYRFDFDVSEIESVTVEYLSSEAQADGTLDVKRLELSEDKWKDMLDGLKALKFTRYYGDVKTVAPNRLLIRNRSGEIEVEAYRIRVNGKLKRYRCDYDAYMRLTNALLGQSGQKIS